MTINTTSNQARFLGNGATTIFPYTFLIPNAADLFVYFTSAAGVTSLLPSSAYTVSGLGQDTGGNVTYNPSGVPIPAGSILVVQRRLPYTQDTDLVNQDGFYPQVVEDALDSLEMQIQQLVQDESLNLRVGVTDTSPGVIPAAAQRAGLVLGFDNSGNSIAVSTAPAGIISSAMQPVVSAATLAAGRAAFGIKITWPIVAVNTNQVVDATFNQNHYVATGPINFTLPRANTMDNGFGFIIRTTTSNVTLIPDSHDNFSGGYAIGANYLTPFGSELLVATDAGSAGVWYVTPVTWSNRQLSVNANTTITNAHNSLTLSLTNNIVITFPTANTLDRDFKCKLINAELWPNGGPQGAAQIITINGASYFLYPGMSYDIFNNGSVWGATPQLGTRYVVQSSGGNTGSQGQTFGVTMFVSNSGNDNLNDGLSASRPLQTITRAHQFIRNNFDHGSYYPQIYLADGTYSETLQSQGSLTGSLLIFCTGNSSPNVIWKPVAGGGGFCLLLSDGAIWEIANVKFDGTGLSVADARFAIFMHQTSIIDFNAGIIFGAFTTSHIGSDHGGGSVNFNASYKIDMSNTINTHIQIGPTYVASLSGGITVTIANSPQISQFLSATGAGAGIYFAPGLTYSGAPAVGCQKWIASSLANIQLSGNTIPGTVAGNPASGAGTGAVVVT